MKMVMVIAACLLLAPRATLCGEDDVKRLANDVSDLERRLSGTEATLLELSKVLTRRGYYRPEKEKQAAAERMRALAEQRAEFEAMTVDQLEDIILDLEDEIEKTRKQEMKTRRLRTKAGRSRKTGGDRQQRKAALREEFAAIRARNETREKARTALLRLSAARSVWEKKALKSSDTEIQQPKMNKPNQ